MTDLQSILSSAIETISDGLGIATPGTVAPGGGLVVQPAAGSAPFTVSHVADHSWCYPGEPLTFHTRVEIIQTVTGLTIQVNLPLDLVPGEYSASANHDGGVPELIITEDGRYLLWRLEREAKAGERLEYEVRTVAPQTPEDLTLESTALLLVAADQNQGQVSETAAVKVRAKGRYLKYLPALYYDDELMGRFLMLFESFWDPIDSQINSIWYYFDPNMTPADFLPWLATWSDLALDERWTEEQQRKLLGSAARLYRMRGTKRGMIEFLQIYTGERAVVTEHRANNLRLGKDARFGHGVALGRSNQPHSFTVSIRLNPIQANEGEDEQSRQHREQERRRTIRSIIEAEKPAHTTYQLFIEEDK